MQYNESKKDKESKDLFFSAQYLQSCMNADESHPDLIKQLFSNSNDNNSHRYFADPQKSASGSMLECTNHLPFPPQISSELANTQCASFMGILPEIHHVWITIDNNLYLWNYMNSQEVKKYDDIKEVILSVSLIKPKENIFKDKVKYLLAVTTPVEIILLAIVVNKNENFNTEQRKGNPFNIFSSIELYDTRYKVPSEGISILKTVGTYCGNIFMVGSDGNVYELDYSDSFSFLSSVLGGNSSRYCTSINQSPISWRIAAAFSSIFSFFSSSFEEEFLDLVVDNPRHMLYLTTTKGDVNAFYFTSPSSFSSNPSSISSSSSLLHVIKNYNIFKELKKFLKSNYSDSLLGETLELFSFLPENLSSSISQSLPQTQSSSTSTPSIPQTSTPSNSNSFPFTLINLFPTSMSESQHVHFVLVLSNGIRIYMSLLGSGNNGYTPSQFINPSPFLQGFDGSLPPTDLQMIRVRCPPSSSLLNNLKADSSNSSTLIPFDSNISVDHFPYHFPDTGELPKFNPSNALRVNHSYYSNGVLFLNNHNDESLIGIYEDLELRNISGSSITSTLPTAFPSYNTPTSTPASFNQHACMKEGVTLPLKSMKNHGKVYSISENCIEIHNTLFNELESLYSFSKIGSSSNTNPNSYDNGENTQGKRIPSSSTYVNNKKRLLTLSDLLLLKNRKRNQSILNHLKSLFSTTPSSSSSSSTPSSSFLVDDLLDDNDLELLNNYDDDNDDIELTNEDKHKRKRRRISFSSNYPLSLSSSSSILPSSTSSSSQGYLSCPIYQSSTEKLNSTHNDNLIFLNDFHLSSFPYLPSLPTSSSIINLSRFFLVLTSNGLYFIKKLKPSDILLRKLLIIDNNNNNQNVTAFFSSYGELQSSIMCLNFLCQLLPVGAKEFTSSISPSDISFFDLLINNLYGANYDTLKLRASNGLTKFSYGIKYAYNPSAISSSSNSTSNFSQTSTFFTNSSSSYPSTSFNPSSSSFAREINPHSIPAPAGTYSTIHDSFYFFFSRIIRTIWSRPIFLKNKKNEFFINNLYSKEIIQNIKQILINLKEVFYKFIPLNEENLSLLPYNRPHIITSSSNNPYGTNQPLVSTENSNYAPMESNKDLYNKYKIMERNSMKSFELLLSRSLDLINLIEFFLLLLPKYNSFNSNQLSLLLSSQDEKEREGDNISYFFNTNNKKDDEKDRNSSFSSSSEDVNNNYNNYYINLFNNKKMLNLMMNLINKSFHSLILSEKNSYYLKELLFIFLKNFFLISLNNNDNEITFDLSSTTPLGNSSNANSNALVLVPSNVGSNPSGSSVDSSTTDSLLSSSNNSLILNLLLNLKENSSSFFSSGDFLQYMSLIYYIQLMKLKMKSNFSSSFLSSSFSSSFSSLPPSSSSFLSFFTSDSSSFPSLTPIPNSTTTTSSLFNRIDYTEEEKKVLKKCFSYYLYSSFSLNSIEKIKNFNTDILFSLSFYGYLTIIHLYYNLYYQFLLRRLKKKNHSSISFLFTIGDLNCSLPNLEETILNDFERENEKETYSDNYYTLVIDIIYQNLITFFNSLFKLYFSSIAPSSSSSSTFSPSTSFLDLVSLLNYTLKLFKDKKFHDLMYNNIYEVSIKAVAETNSSNSHTTSSPLLSDHFYSSNLLLFIHSPYIESFLSSLDPLLLYSYYILETEERTPNYFKASTLMKDLALVEDKKVNINIRIKYLEKAIASLYSLRYFKNKTSSSATSSISSTTTSSAAKLLAGSLQKINEFNGSLSPSFFTTAPSVVSASNSSLSASYSSSNASSFVIPNEKVINNSIEILHDLLDVAEYQKIVKNLLGNTLHKLKNNTSQSTSSVTYQKEIKKIEDWQVKLEYSLIPASELFNELSRTYQYFDISLELLLLTKTNDVELIKRLWRSFIYKLVPKTPAPASTASASSTGVSTEHEELIYQFLSSKRSINRLETSPDSPSCSFLHYKIWINNLCDRINLLLRNLIKIHNKNNNNSSSSLVTSSSVSNVSSFSNSISPSVPFLSLPPQIPLTLILDELEDINLMILSCSSSSTLSEEPSKLWIFNIFNEIIPINQIIESYLELLDYYYFNSSSSSLSTSSTSTSLLTNLNNNSLKLLEKKYQLLNNIILILLSWLQKNKNDLKLNKISSNHSHFFYLIKKGELKRWIEKINRNLIHLPPTFTSLSSPSSSSSINHLRDMLNQIERLIIEINSF